MGHGQKVGHVIHGSLIQAYGFGFFLFLLNEKLFKFYSALQF